MDPQFYDNIDAQPCLNGKYKTLIQYFYANVQERGEHPFLGTRRNTGRHDANDKPVFGEYEWLSFNQVKQLVDGLAKGIMLRSLCPAIEAEGRRWHFLGIWAKNRWEWTVSLLAAMNYNVTVVGFYDAMSVD